MTGFVAIGVSSFKSVKTHEEDNSYQSNYLLSRADDPCAKFGGVISRSKKVCCPKRCERCLWNKRKCTKRGKMCCTSDVWKKNEECSITQKAPCVHPPLEPTTTETPSTTVEATTTEAPTT